MSVFDTYPESQLVGLSGTLGSGKDTAARHLVRRHGFMHVSSGDVLRAEARARGRDTLRPTLIEIGQELRAARGMGALSIRGMELWEQQHGEYPGGLVVSGLRSVGESQEIKTQGGTLVFIDAPVEKRFRKMTRRGRNDAYATLAEFQEHEKLELEGLLGPDSPHLRAVQAIADIASVNNFNKQFFSDIDDALSLVSQ